MCKKINYRIFDSITVAQNDPIDTLPHQAMIHDDVSYNMFSKDLQSCYYIRPLALISNSKWKTSQS
jgi:hypothetical protein